MTRHSADVSEIREWRALRALGPATERLEAVVVTHNSGRDMRRFVSSRANLRSFSRIIVVDNGSTDDTCEAAEGAGVEVRRLPDNLGFGTAANRGIGDTTGETVALLNPDINMLDALSIARLGRHFADPRVALIAPALVLPDGSIQDSARRVPTRLTSSAAASSSSEPGRSRPRPRPTWRGSSAP